MICYFIFSAIFFSFFIMQTVSFSDSFSFGDKSISQIKEFNLDDVIKFKSNSSDNRNAVHYYDILDKQKIKIVAAGDFGCGPVAQSNIKT